VLRPSFTPATSPAHFPTTHEKFIGTHNRRFLSRSRSPSCGASSCPFANERPRPFITDAKSVVSAPLRLDHALFGTFQNNGARSPSNRLLGTTITRGETKERTIIPRVTPWK